jgi:hypothetical protein
LFFRQAEWHATLLHCFLYVDLKRAFSFGETQHQLTIRDYLRHSNLHVTNNYLQATPESKPLAQGKLVDAILPGGLLSASKSTLIQ